MFLTSTDYEGAIKSSILTRLLDGVTDASATKDDAETKAISLMQGYLNARYDVDAIFSAVADDRHPIIVKYCMDIVIYELYALLQPDQLPELRKDRYDTAEKWLRSVMKCDINPPGLPVLDEGVRDYIVYGGRTPSNFNID